MVAHYRQKRLVSTFVYRFADIGGNVIMPFKTKAHIKSLNGETDEITVLEQVGNNDYIVDYKGVKCHAIFNPFVCEYYADNIYGRIGND